MTAKIIKSLICYFVSFAVIGLYVLLLHFIGIAIWPEQTHGNIIKSPSRQIRGSFLLGQDFKHPEYFLGRPKQILDNQCNSQFYIGEYKNVISKRVSDLKGATTYVELVVPSASLLDPYISMEAALSQVRHIAKSKGIPETELEALVQSLALKSRWPFFSMNIVNTVRLNESLCKITTCRGF